jgi:hypothetical protein
MSLLALPSTAKLALPRWLPLVVIVLVAVALRAIVVANADVSWGLVMAEKWLDGARLYVDIIEVNPPATVFLYAVPIVLERVSGARAEIFVDALVFLAVGLSLWLAGRILLAAKLLEPAEKLPLLTVLAAVLTILPAQTFGEREHIALVVFLPLLAVAAARAVGKSPALPMAILAGIGGGIAVVIKPHFAGAIVCTAAAAALGARSWRPLFALENWIAAAMLAAYAILVMVAFPHFGSDVLPLVMAVYVPVKAVFVKFIVFVATPIWVATLLVIALIKRGAMVKPPFSLLLASSFGFSISYYAQQKGWAYHSYPMLALALIALALAFIDRWHRGPVDNSDRLTRIGTALVGAVLAGATFCWMNFAVDRSALAAPIQAIAPHPKMLMIGGDLAVGHPITRQVGGIWVSRVSAQWITGGVWLRRLGETLDPATDARLEAYAGLDRTMLIEDIARNRPDVILIQLMPGFDWPAWARVDPALAAELEAYRPYQTVRDVLILRRSEGR